MSADGQVASEGSALWVPVTIRLHDSRRTTGLPGQGRRRSDREERPEGEAPARQAADDQGRLRSHRSRHSPRPHGGHAEDEALPAARPPGHLSDRRFHRHDRRPDGKEGHPAAVDERADPAERRDLQAAGLQDPRLTRWPESSSATTSASDSTPISPSPCTSFSTLWRRATTRWL